MINTLGSVGSVMRLSKPTMFEKHSSTLDQDVDMYNQIGQEPEVKSVDSEGILSPELAPHKKLSQTLSPHQTIET